MNIKIDSESFVDVIDQAFATGTPFAFVARKHAKDRRTVELVLQSGDWVGPRPRMRLKRTGHGAMVEFFLDEAQEQ